MTLSFCTIFKTIVAQGNFNKSAEVLHMTPSAISHAVSEAESQMGFKLFNRTKNGITLTECGETLYPFITKLLNGNEALNQSIDQLKGLEIGVTKLGIFNSTCTNWMPDILKDFGAKYPGIQIDIYEGSYNDVENWIKSGVVDFGMLSTSCTTDLPVEPLYSDPLVCIVPNSFKTKKEGYITIEEMQHQQFVIQREGSDADVQFLIKKYGLHLHSNCHVLDDTSIMAMIECGRGISVMATMTAKGLEGDLKVLHIIPNESRIIGLSTLDKKMLSPASKELYKYIEEYASKLKTNELTNK